MNHNTARCSSCNTICVLPHLRARASAAKCEACARRDSSRGPEERLGWAPGTLVTYRGEVREIVKCYADGKAAICKPGGKWLGVEAPMGECQVIDPALKNMVGPPRGSFEGVLKRVYQGDFVDDKWEQRARELTEERRRDRRACSACFVYFAADNCEMCTACWTAWTTPSFYVG